MVLAVCLEEPAVPGSRAMQIVFFFFWEQCWFSNVSKVTLFYFALLSQDVHCHCSTHEYTSGGMSLARGSLAQYFGQQNLQTALFLNKIKANLGPKQSGSVESLLLHKKWQNNIALAKTFVASFVNALTITCTKPSRSLEQNITK